MRDFVPTFQLPDSLPRIIAGARAGIGYAAWLLANRYLVGDGVERDLEQAAHWFLVGARRGCHLAQRSYAWMIESGMAPGSSQLEMLKWRRTAADNGDRVSQRLIGEMYLYGRGIGLDTNLGIRYLRLAADALDPIATRMLALHEALGAPPPESPGATYLILMRLMHAGSAPAAYALSQCYASGWGSQTANPEEMRIYLNLAAERQHPAAMRDLARVICKESLSTPILEAINLLHRAANAGDGMAMALLGGYYASPEADQLDTAVIWFKKSAEANYSGAYAHWADSVGLGPKPSAHPKVALYLALKAKYQGFADARLVLTMLAHRHYGALSQLIGIDQYLQESIYTTDIGPAIFFAEMLLGRKDSVQLNKCEPEYQQKLSLFWLQAAVEELNTCAMCSLAKELLRPDSSTHDAASALALLQTGSYLGDDACSAMLAYEFATNTKIIRNYRYAAQINHHAARSGNLDAMHNLSANFHNGDGVPVDHEAASYWASKRLAKLADSEPGLPMKDSSGIQRKSDAKLLQFGRG